MDFSYLDRNVAEIRRRIDVACEGAEREGVMLLAAVKYAECEEIEYLTHTLGVREIGENRVQQLLEHAERVDLSDVNIHFIGTLQTNKVKYIIDKVKLIHSLDSEKLAAEIDKQAKKHGIVMDVLVEINCGEEESKSGLLPSEVEEFCKGLSKYSNVCLRGFMTMAPRCEKKEEYLKFFGETYAQVLDIWTKKLHNIDRPVISMGMSESFCEAIECGSTLVRVGRGMFVKS